MELESNETEDKLNLMTLHAAKGLEFDIVFLPGWEEGLFPSQRTLDEKGTTGLEEERRLAYVGLTRAKKRVFISFAANRRVHGQWQSALPSRFISELPEAHVDAVADEGFYGNYGSFRDNQQGGFSSPYSSPGWRRAQEARASGRERERAPIIDVHGEAGRDRRSERGEIRNRRARLPPEIRLWPHRRGRRQQAAGRFRQGRLEARDGQLRRESMSPIRLASTRTHIMDFEIVGELTDVETIAAGRRIRELSRLHRLYGKGFWRKMKGGALHTTTRWTDSSSLNCTGTKHMGSARKSSSARRYLDEALVSGLRSEAWICRLRAQ